MKKPTVLIVEDDVNLIGHLPPDGQVFGLYADFLAERARILHAESEAEARELILKHGSDLKVAVMDGFIVGGTSEQLTDWLHQRHPALPIIASSSDREMNFRLVRLGCVAKTHLKSDVPKLVLGTLAELGC
jgi:hypothetical protein